LTARAAFIRAPFQTKSWVTCAFHTEYAGIFPAEPFAVSSTVLAPSENAEL
jgi:hypothetical protein